MGPASSTKHPCTTDFRVGRRLLHRALGVVVTIVRVGPDFVRLRWPSHVEGDYEPGDVARWYVEAWS